MNLRGGLWFLGLLASTMLLVVSCGSGGGPTTPSQPIVVVVSPTPSPSPTPTPSPTPAPTPSPTPSPTPTPTPTPSGLSVTVFTNSGFSGSSITFTSDQSNLSFVRPGPCSEGSEPNWNDCISSIRLGANTAVKVYMDSGFSGNSTTFTSDQTNLSFVSGPCSPGSTPNWNDCISSIQLLRR